MYISRHIDIYISSVLRHQVAQAAVRAMPASTVHSSTSARRESDQFVLLPPDAEHAEVVFSNLPQGALCDESRPLCATNLPALSEVFVGRQVTAPCSSAALHSCKQINRSHTHTHTDREQRPRHRHTHTHDKNNTPNPKRTPPTNTLHRSKVARRRCVNTPFSKTITPFSSGNTPVSLTTAPVSSATMPFSTETHFFLTQPRPFLTQPRPSLVQPRPSLTETRFF